MSLKSFARAVVPPSVISALRPLRRLQLRARSRWRAASFLQRFPQPRRVELGPGTLTPPPGWITVDLFPTSDFYADLRERLPFPDHSIAEIYSSHVCEHLSFADLKHLFGEAIRVLEPGGVFNVVVPNGGMYVRSYTDPSLRAELMKFAGNAPDCELATAMDLVNHMAHLGGEHRFLFDEDNLVALLSACGFQDVRHREFDPDRDHEARRLESLFCVARSPR